MRSIAYTSLLIVSAGIGLYFVTIALQSAALSGAPDADVESLRRAFVVSLVMIGLAVLGIVTSIWKLLRIRRVDK